MKTEQKKPTEPIAAPSLETPSGKNKNTENFPVGSFLLRTNVRPHVHAYYNFARAADDIGDDPLMESSEKLHRLTRFEQVLAGDDKGDVPSATALRERLRQSKVDAVHGTDLIRAFKQDAVKRRYRNWDELMEYCRYSASPVGRYVLALHGAGQEAWEANDALCSALQVINHLQDCADDYRELDRVYLPEEDMLACGMTVSDLSKDKASPALRKVLDMQLERLRPMLKTAWGLPPRAGDFRLRLETALICALAEALIRLLARRDPLSENVKLSKPAIFFTALGGMLRGLFA